MPLFTEFNTLSVVLLSMLGAAILIQLSYYWLVYARVAFYRSKEIASPMISEMPPVSVVMTARDEYHHLVRFLPLILEQDYPQYEVIVVNHTSSDETASLLKELGPRYPHLKVVNIEQELNFFKGKKFPLSIGIKSARNEILLLTDADCQPASDQWIKHMTSAYQRPTEVVLGYGPYEKRKGFLNKIIRYDTVMVAMQYLGWALAGQPYMGVGRNLSYHRQVFIRNKGFTSHYKVSSGDDDLFINKVATKRNTGVMLHPESFMISAPKTSFETYFRQKRRHLTTGRYYKTKTKWILGAGSVSQLLFWTLTIVMLSLWIQPLLVGAAFVIREISVAIIQKKVMDRLAERQLLLFSLLFEPLHVVMTTLFGLYSTVKQPREWK